MCHSWNDKNRLFVDTLLENFSALETITLKHANYLRLNVTFKLGPLNTAKYMYKVLQAKKPPQIIEIQKNTHTETCHINCVNNYLQELYNIRESMNTTDFCTDWLQTCKKQEQIYKSICLPLS